jgi:AcrR family transcriptional regulator
VDVPSRRERQKAAARDAILRAGMELFSRHGIDAVTVDRIAEVADVGKGTIYNYFPTKESIVVAFLANVERAVQRMLAPLEQTHRPLADTLVEYVALQWRMKRRHHRFVKLFFAQMFLNTDAFFPYMVEIHGLVAKNMESLFRALQERGDIRRDVSVADLTMVFTNMQMGLTAQWALEGPPFAGTEATLRREIELFCEGIEANRT